MQNKNNCRSLSSKGAFYSKTTKSTTVIAQTKLKRHRRYYSHQEEKCTMSRKQARIEGRRVRGRQEEREKASDSIPAGSRRNRHITLPCFIHEVLIKLHTKWKTASTLHHSTLHSVGSLLPSAFLPSFTQCFLTLS